MNASPAAIEVRGVVVGYGETVIQQNLNFQVRRGEVFVVLGGSGSGKSSVLKAMIGLNEPLAGEILIDGEDFVRADGDDRLRLLRKFGVMYQSGALFGSMTVLENVRMPLDEFSDLDRDEKDLVALGKLNQVSLLSAAAQMPSELSGGMKKRAAIARALALDPGILFLDEPSAGLDPVTSARLDDLILELRDSLGCTFVVVSHELSSIFTIADTAAFLDPDARTMTAIGAPRRLLAESTDPAVRAFLTRRAQPGRAVASGAPQISGSGPMP
jgi:phospholipid/cholesterol/gamma-HCH transport system ATP-binding protein